MKNPENQTEEKGSTPEQSPVKNENATDAGKNESQNEEKTSSDKTEKPGQTTTSPIKNGEGEQIGTSTKTETPEKTESEVKPNPGAEPIEDVTKPSQSTKNDDGSTTITTPTVTPGKETTTITGSGSASASTKEDFTTKKEDINLKDELGEKPDIPWEIKEGEHPEVGKTGYKVDTVVNDGNKQTLTLKKETETKGTMTADDIAKLVDAERTDNPDGSYTLTRTEKYKDENGNEQTRTTYITVEKSGVTIKTTTILTVTREKVEHKSDEISASNNFKYPDIEVKNTNPDKANEKTTISSKELEKMITDENLGEDGRYYYEETAEDGTKKEYIITVDKEAAGKLSNAEIVAKINSKDFILGDDEEIYYVANGERAKLSPDQKNVLREKLSITVQLRVTSKSETKSDGKEEQAKETAQIEALKEALRKAAKEAGVPATSSEEFEAALNRQITSASLKGGTFTFAPSHEVTDKTFTFTFGATSVGETPTITDATDPTVPGYDKDKITDVKDNTYTGSATISTGKMTWNEKENYKHTEEGSYTEGIRPDFDFTKAPDGATKVQTKGGYVTYYELNGKIYEFTYTTGTNTEGNTTDTFTTVSWTVTTPMGSSTTEEKDTRPTESFELSKSWGMSGNDTDGYDFTFKGGSASGLRYKGKDKAGNDIYEGTAANGTVTTITVKSNSVDESLIEAKLKEKYGSTVTLDKENKTFTYKDGNTTYTGSYSSVEQTIDVVQKAPYEVAGTGNSAKEAEEAILANIKKALANLGENEELIYNDEYHITTETKWENIVEYVRTVVNYDALTKEDLSALLKQQKEAAAGKDYTGTTKGTWYVKPDGTTISDRDRNFTYWNGKAWYWEDGQWNGHHWVGGGWKELDESKKFTTEDDYIGHLDLATDSKLTLAEKNAEGKLTDDCVLINKTLEWNEDADKLLNNDGNTVVGLGDRITYDDENDKDPTTGHYEFARATWDDQYGWQYKTDKKDNNPDRSVFYKLTGTVAYGQVGETYTSKKGYNGQYDYKSARDKAEAALKKYKEDYVKNGGNPDDLKNAQVVEICSDQTPYGERSYKIYLYTSSLTAYGYLSDASNTCGNAHYNAQNKNSYVGGYDLTIGDLTQISKEEIVAQGKNVFNYSTTLTKVSRILGQTNQSFTATPGTKTTTVITPADTKTGSHTAGTIVTAKEKNWNFADEGSDTTATGSGSHKTFREWLHDTFSGEKEAVRDTGTFTYSYATEKDAELQAEEMSTTVQKDAWVTYHYKTVETKDVLIPGEDIVHVDPELPDGPETPSSNENTVDTPVLPANPELPPVQDARPDAPVLPANPELPPVQDARMDTVSFGALPQTGVNWRTAIGLAISGMTLMAAGAFTTLTGKKEKH